MLLKNTTENKFGLIGCSGLVGKNILKQSKKSWYLYNSSNIKNIQKYFDLLVCAAPSGHRRWANSNSKLDFENVANLISILSKVSAKKFVLISTTEVYDLQENVDETSPINPLNLSSYGKNRWSLEEHCRSFFNNCLIIRLPIIFGVGLKKNIVYDLIHGSYNYTNKDNIFQFYDLKNLWKDIWTLFDFNIRTINLLSEPIHVNEIAKDLFNVILENTTEELRKMNIKSIHSKDGYIYNKKNIYKSIEGYRNLI